MPLLRYLESNRVVVAAGLPLCGKTDLLCRIALDEQKRHASYIFAADTNGNIPRELWDKRPTNVLRHPTGHGDPYNSVRTALASSTTAGRFHTVRTASATPLFHLGKLVAMRGLREVRPGSEDKHGVQSILLVDEAVLWSETALGQLGPNVEEALTQRRHLHMMLLMGTQAPHRVHYLCFELATQLELFTIDSARGRARLSDGGVPDRILDVLPGLPFRHRVSWVRGEPHFRIVRPDGTATRHPAKEKPAALPLGEAVNE